MSNQRILAHELDANISWSVIGLDLAKNDVSLVGITADGEIIRVDRMSYEILLEKAQAMLPTTFAMEPCSEMNHLVNQFEAMGHKCKVIGGYAVRNYINTYFAGQKNDLHDAEALAFLAKDSRLQSIRAKTPEEMQLVSLVTIREHYVDLYRKTLVSLKGIAQFWGLRISRLLSDEAKLIAKIEDASNIPPELKETLISMVKSYKALERTANSLKKKIEAFASKDELCKKVMEIPGVGAMIATRLKATLGDVDRFEKPKRLPAYYGLVPRSFTTGHVQKMGRITKRGDKVMRTYLIQGAGALLLLEKKGKLRDCQLKKWIARKRLQLPYCKLVVALAAKILRIIWAILYKGERFNLKKAGVAKCSLSGIC